MNAMELLSSKRFPFFVIRTLRRHGGCLTFEQSYRTRCEGTVLLCWRRLLFPSGLDGETKLLFEDRLKDQSVL